MSTKKALAAVVAVMVGLIAAGCDLNLSSDPPKREYPTYYTFVFRNQSSVRVTVTVEGDTFGVNRNRETEHLSLSRTIVFVFSPNTTVDYYETPNSSGSTVTFYDR